MKKYTRWIFLALIAAWYFGSVMNGSDGAPGLHVGGSQTKVLTYSQFLNAVKGGEVQYVQIDGKNIDGYFASGSTFKTVIPTYDDGLINDLIRHNVEIEGAQEKKQSLLMSIFISWFPMILFIFIWFMVMKKMAGGKGGVFSVGKSRAKLMNGDNEKVTFADVAGVDEAREEVSELVEFLKNPSRFSDIGGKIPRGVLMSGSPGTGKTLLAKAIAGEAGVPFFFISGSDFVEMFVGVGASRVRDMFAEAKKRAPCIIFIDEIDAVGRRRNSMPGGGNDEREQTLNQLLVEMDGFGGGEGIIVIAATNRPDVLDPALLRPGRFDRQIVVPLPDVRGRDHILKVHLRKVSVSSNIDTSLIARGTPGFSGADLANLVNEAALMAAKDGRKSVEMQHLERAKDKIMMGAERRSMVMSDEEKLLTAYHEAGHAIVGLKLDDHDPVYKVTIIPRGRALGVTMFIPDEDRVSYSKDRLESQLCTLYGGRVAEEIVFGQGKVTTGASNDIHRATEIARNMVTKWGLSDDLGPLSFIDGEGNGFLGSPVVHESRFSDETSKIIDDQIRKIIVRNYEKAKSILTSHINELHLMANELVKHETIDSDQISQIMRGFPIGKCTQSDDKDSSSISGVATDKGVNIAIE